MKNLLLAVFAIILVSSCQNSGVNVPGYKVVVHEKGTGAKVNPAEYVEFEFESYDGSGELIQSTKENEEKPQIKIPAENEPSGNAFTRLVAQLSVGDSVSMFYPYDSLKGAPTELAGQELEYRVKVLKTLNEDEYKASQAKLQEQQNQKLLAAKADSEKRVSEAAQLLNDYKAGKFKANSLKTKSGMTVVTLREGDGPQPTKGQNVSVGYVGIFKLSGTRFDDSYSRAQPFTFPLGMGRVIKGWDEGVQYIKKGGKALLDIPYPLAYGEAGAPPNIPAKSDLVFIVELDDIK